MKVGTLSLKNWTIIIFTAPKKIKKDGIKKINGIKQNAQVSGFMWSVDIIRSRCDSGVVGSNVFCPSTQKNRFYRERISIKFCHGRQVQKGATYQ